jgi:hypothetical protein
MGNTKSNLTRDLMKHEHIEALIAELEKIRDRESEILIELKDIIRNRIEEPPRTQIARRTPAPNPGGAIVPVRDRTLSNRNFSFGRGTTDKTPQVLATVNSIARGNRVFLRTRVNKPAEWPANRKFNQEASRYAIVTNIASSKISVITDTKIETWRAPHNVQRIIE